MTFREYLTRSEHLAERDFEHRVRGDLAEADRLIRDLAALVDAGLVVVEPHVLGPARYAVRGAQLDEAA